VEVEQMLLDHHVEFRLGRTASAMVPSTGDEADEVTGVSGVNVSPDDPYRRGGEVFDWPGNWFGLAPNLQSPTTRGLVDRRSSMGAIR
jgi:hypothetical protein